MARLRQISFRKAAAFTLLEVVAAVAVFAVGAVGVAALMAPVARTVGTSSDLEAAARVVDALRVKLHTMPTSEVLTLLKKSNGTTRHELTDADQRSDYNPAADVQILYANRDGSKIGTYTSSVWLASGRNQDVEKYFEIALIRNETLSPLPASPTEELPEPPIPDDTAPVIAYVARLRWPAFIRQGPAAAVQSADNAGGLVRYDHSMKQSLFVTGTIQR